MEIREIMVDDYIQIASLNKQLGYDFPIDEVKQRIEKNLSCTRDKILVAVNEENLVIGYIHASPYELLYCESLINILGFVVDEQHRNQGIGKQLLKSIEEWARSNNYKGIRLNSGGNRAEAHKFYESCGYICNKEQKRFVKSFE